MKDTASGITDVERALHVLKHRQDDRPGLGCARGRAGVGMTEFWGSGLQPQRPVFAHDTAPKEFLAFVGGLYGSESSLPLPKLSLCTSGVLDLVAAKGRVLRTSALACFVVRFPRGKSGCQGQEQRQRRVGQDDKSMMPVEGLCSLVLGVYHQGISGDLRASGTVERVGQ